MTTTPHKHAEAIKAWANGETIQHFNYGSKKWQDCEPQWNPDAEYRVKPVELERVYPETKLTHDKMLSHWYSGSNVIGHEAETKAMYRVANAAIRDAIDKGQVLDSFEFNRGLDERAAREVELVKAGAKAMYNTLHTTTARRAYMEIAIDYESIIEGVKL